MERLIAEVIECIDSEYGRASEKFGSTNNSDHESYAIILEEVEEAQQELSYLKGDLSALWSSVKMNSSDEHKLNECSAVERTALLAACEFIQVAAMAKKAAITIRTRQENAKYASGDSV